MKITPYQLCMLQAMHLVLHGLRALLWHHKIDGPAQEMQTGMEGIDRYIRENK